ncbi:MAG: hypothetical protein H6Q72_4392 [Firmicutes bacterium]|nr:hypothetical protein [Bacillota bacterium]
MKIVNGNITLKSSIFNELERLNNIHSEACDYFSFDKNHTITKPKDCLTKGDLPPNGTKDNYEILSIYERDNLIGFITMYIGFPFEKEIYICFIYISNKSRYKGHGKKIIDVISAYFKKNKFESIRISVSLKNWNGIRFWHKCGFNHLTIVDIEGDFSEENYGCIELKKTILK